MPTANDKAWERYILQKKLPLDGRTHVVTAKDLKTVAQREPRLMAKFNTPRQVPVVLRKSGYALIAITNGEYLLFKGTLFAPIPKCQFRIKFKSQTAFPLLTAGRGTGEAEYLDNAFNSGILPDFTGVKRLYLTIRGRERTGAFDFSVADSNLTIQTRGVQIETDAGYEGERDIILVEAKIGTPSHFNIRQLYYPFRHFSAIAPQKQVRTLFFEYDLNTATYTFYEFTFKEPTVFDSIQLSRCCTYFLMPPRFYKIDELLDVRFETPSEIAPQADDLNKILEMLALINTGQNTTAEIADHFVFDKRQSYYYGEAAEYLGLISRQQGIFELTPHGEKFLKTPPEHQREFIAKLIVNSWIFKKLVDAARRKVWFSHEDVETIIATAKMPDNRQRYTKSTVSRRRRTIIAWTNWLSEQLGVFKREGGKYRLA